MMTTPRHLSRTNSEEVQTRIDSIEGNGREVGKNPFRLASSHCIVCVPTSLLSILKNLGLRLSSGVF